MTWRRNTFKNVLCVGCTSLLLLFLMQLFHKQYNIKATPALGSSKQRLSDLQTTLATWLRAECEFVGTNKTLHQEKLHIGFIFDNVEPHGSLQKNLYTCLGSIFATTSVPYSMFVLHIVGDNSSFIISKDVLKDLKLDKLIQVQHHNKDTYRQRSKRLLDPIVEVLSDGRRHRFSDPLYYVSTVLHKLVPHNVSRLVLLDADLVFKSDIAGLFEFFSKFEEHQVIGIAREHQPTYRHKFRDYRLSHPGTKVGEPAPDGLTGVNSGVLLLDLARMRCSPVYNSIFVPGKVEELAKEYMFYGNLGDQDLYTLMQLWNPDLLYLLPCAWNRQLCQFWKRDELLDVFDLFYNCSEPIHVFHGNCQTKISNVL